jgi:RNA polymerase sigma-70 factor (ECF subfamily)
MITRSRALDRRRASMLQQQREQSLDIELHLLDTTPGPAETSVAQQEYVLVQAALQSLPPEQRQVIELAYFSELSHRDIAEVLGLPLGTVKIRIRLGMLHLRVHLLPVIRESL